eukprot:5781509-Pyramimonas_sp.AAC.1
MLSARADTSSPLPLDRRRADADHNGKSIMSCAIVDGVGPAASSKPWSTCLYGHGQCTAMCTREPQHHMDSATQRDAPTARCRVQRPLQKYNGTCQLMKESIDIRPPSSIS